MNPDFQGWLKREIDERMPVARFAELVGVRRWTIYGWLTGRTSPQGHNIARLARALQVDRSVIDEKLRGEVAA